LVLEDKVEGAVEDSKEDRIDYLGDHLLSIDKVQADKFFPNRIEGECGWCRRKCYGIKGLKPDTCSYCYIELRGTTKRASLEIRQANVNNAVRWARYRKEEWTPSEFNKPVFLDGSTFTHPVIEVLPAKKRSDRNYGT
jgi:hypothetical protein